MAKFSLKVDPTFKTKVGLHVPGQGEVQVQFEFKGRSRSELAELSKEMARAAQDAPDMTDADPEEAVQQTIARESRLVMSVAVGWELDDDFNEENVRRLLQKCPRSADAILKKYLQEVSQAQLGN